MLADRSSTPGTAQNSFQTLQVRPSEAGWFEVVAAEPLERNAGLPARLRLHIHCCALGPAEDASRRALVVHVCRALPLAGLTTLDARDYTADCAWHPVFARCAHLAHLVLPHTLVYTLFMTLRGFMPGVLFPALRVVTVERADFNAWHATTGLSILTNVMSVMKHWKLAPKKLTLVLRGCRVNAAHVDLLRSEVGRQTIDWDGVTASLDDVHPKPPFDRLGSHGGLFKHL
ncbi:hypothetical protein BV25DRAFT_1833349 [Artomyces pyxidatus]|uniref:Uncharacterized protein n=1 Tax=Artomyces pyxidatus TaxID=48021 RepID=A0ACB8SHE5_9AGAM|nr:hypothetical protein BV25DRAFT_1833349 [Artomyces pyxidatus]